MKKFYSLALAVSLSAALPAVSRVDGGTLEVIRAAGVTVRSSDTLVQYTKAIWGDAGRTAHYVEERSKASGGRFEVRDDVLNKTWSLELVRVHKDKLQALADGRYFACVDFKAPDATMVDVDFYLKKDGDKLAVTDTTVHKIDGKARYNYEEKNGVWVRVAEKS